MNLYSDKSFYTVVFNYEILSIMLILGGFLKPFTVCITIKTIPTFPILNYFPLLFRILFSSFFFLLLDASIPHIFFSDYECECISLYVHSLIIYFLSSDTPDTDFSS